MKGFYVLAAMFWTVRDNIAHLVKLDVPFGNSSHIEDGEQVESIGESLNQLTV
jgi:hypothetical protein